MKSTIILSIFTGSILLASCQELRSKSFTLDVTVVDQEGKAVDGAIVSGSNEKLINNGPVTQAEYEPVKVNTDTQGKSKLKLIRFSERPSGFVVRHNDYYATRHLIEWPKNKPDKNINKASTTAVIKKIKNPIGMHVKNFESSSIDIPELNVEYFYDLELHDYLPPVGKGQAKDMRIFASGVNDRMGNANINLKLTMLGDGCGFLKFTSKDREYNSELISDYKAPEKDYMPEVTFEFNSKEPSLFMNQDSSTNFYIKARPKYDDVNKKIQWHFGKIYGPLSLFAGKKSWSNSAAFLRLDSIYFNPKAGDTNVEFDPDKNLLKNQIKCSP